MALSKLTSNDALKNWRLKINEVIDELDRLVNCEMSYQKNESDKQREALRVLLTEIDNLENSGVFVIATGNVDIDELPAALVRNGRIEK